MKIIVSIQKPIGNRSQEAEWRAILSEINSLIQDGAKADTLNEGVWQILSEDGLPVLGYVLREAEAQNLSHRVVFVESGDEWKRSF